MSTAVIGAPGFRASSGRTVRVGGDGTVMFDHANGYLSPASAMDAEEFFQAKRDEKQGRWRWPENPDYVVYPPDDRVGIRVLHEPTGNTIVGSRKWFADHADGLFEREQPHMYGAAHAYFQAHPERKPWQDAKPGELWDLVAEGKENRYAAILSKIPGGEYVYLVPVNDPHAPRLGVNAPVITSGERVQLADAA